MKSETHEILGPFTRNVSLVGDSIWRWLNASSISNKDRCAVRFLLEGTAGGDQLVSATTSITMMETAYCTYDNHISNGVLL